MDYEGIAENTTETTIPNAWVKHIKTHEIVLIICCILAIIADVVIASTILRFKQMRTPSNIPIANWAIIDLCFLLVMPAGYKMSFPFNLPQHFSCFLLQMGCVLHVMIIVSVFIVMVNWCVAAYFPKCLVRIKIYITLELVSVWATVLIFLITVDSGCSNYRFHRSMEQAKYITLFLLFVYIVVVRFVNVLRKYRGRVVEHPKLAIILCTSFIACYAIAMGTYAFFGTVLWIHSQACPIFCNSLVTLSVLCFCDKSFQLHLKKTFQCKFRRHGNSFGDSESLEQEPFSEVSFHCPTEQLRTNK